MLHLLSTLHAHLDVQYQQSLTNSLTALSASLPVNTRVECLGLPSLRLLLPLVLDSDQLPHREAAPLSTSPRSPPSSPSSLPTRLQRIQQAEAEVFLFSPDDEDDVGRSLAKPRQLQRLHFVSGELLQVEAVLGNPLRLPLRVQSIELQVEGVEFVAHSSSIVLPPETAETTVTLTGRPLSAGRLHIQGCLIRCFNLLSEHSVDHAGRGIPPPHVRSLHVCSDSLCSASEADDVYVCAAVASCS